MAKAQNKTLEKDLSVSAYMAQIEKDDRPRLGAHKMGKSCLYIKRLSDVDKDVLEEVIAKGLKIMEEKYPQ